MHTTSGLCSPVPSKICCCWCGLILGPGLIGDERRIPFSGILRHRVNSGSEAAPDLLCSQAANFPSLAFCLSVCALGRMGWRVSPIFPSAETLSVWPLFPALQISYSFPRPSLSASWAHFHVRYLTVLWKSRGRRRFYPHSVDDNTEAQRS